MLKEKTLHLKCILFFLTWIHEKSKGCLVLITGIYIVHAYRSFPQEIFWSLEPKNVLVLVLKIGYAFLGFPVCLSGGRNEGLQQPQHLCNVFEEPNFWPGRNKATRKGITGGYFDNLLNLFKKSRIHLRNIISPGSSDSSYIVTYYIKWVTTSWTHSNIKQLPAIWLILQ